MAPFFTKRAAASSPDDDSCQNGGSSYVVPAASTTHSKTSKDATASSLSHNRGCWPRFTAELNPCQPWFHVADAANNNRKIDIPESFAPASCQAFLWKLLAGGLTIGTLIYSWVSSASPEFWLAYLTNWGLLFSCLYFVLSLLNTVLAARTPQPPDAVGWRIRLTWIFFELAAHFEVLISILYWILVFERGETQVTFVSVVSHSVVAVLVLIDGLYVNCIPVRMMHWYGVVFPMYLAYAVWTLIQSYANIGNPDEQDNDPSTNDDVVYESINWEDNWVQATIIVVILLFVAGPLLHVFLWTTSLYNLCCQDRRRYVDSVDENDHRPTLSDVEEGSIFARWK